MIPRLFLDTNVVLDLLGERNPFYDDAAIIASMADRGEIKMIVSALTFSTVHYLLSKFEKEMAVRKKLGKLRILSEICDLTSKIIDKSLSSKFTDFEDALQYQSAISMDCAILITRNEKDFRGATISIMNPREFLSSLP